MNIIRLCGIWGAQKHKLGYITMHRHHRPKLKEIISMEAIVVPVMGTEGEADPFHLKDSR